MRVLVACEFSGIVREAFTKRGHDAWSCDFLPTEQPTYNHIQGDVAGILDLGWDLMIAHPPCTYLTVTANKWMKPEFASRFPERQLQREAAIDFFLDLAWAPINKICIENPVGIISTMWRPPDQYIQPYEFGIQESKKTGLWLKGLPKLAGTKMVEPIVYNYGGRDSQWHVKSAGLPPLERMKARSRTFTGIADAMAEQWG